MGLLDNLKNKVEEVKSVAQAVKTVANNPNILNQHTNQSTLNQGIIEKALADAQRNALTIEIETKEDMQFVHVKMDDTSIQTEAGAMYYYKGNISMDASSGPGLGTALLTGESMRRPIYTGSGELVLEPTYGQYTIFNIDNEEWIINYGKYYASELSVILGSKKASLSNGILAGHGFAQTTVAGQGRVIIESDGPLEKIELVNDKLVVDGNFAIIWSASLELKVEKATKGIFSSMLSGEGLVNTYSGTGTVYLCPAATKLQHITSQIGSGLESIFDKIK